MTKKVLNKKAKVEIAPNADKKTVWSIVGNAAIDYIDAKPKEEWFTLDEVVNYLIENGKVSIVAPEKVQEVLTDMFMLFVGNHILLVNENKEYRKFTLEDTPFGKKGIIIEGKNNGKKKPIDI